MIWISLAVNVGVLLPVCASLLVAAGWTQSAYGGSTPARGILLSIYLAILVASVLLGLGMLVAPSERWTTMAVALFAIQVAYKVTTPFTVGTIRNPVVVSNLAIAAIHMWTIAITLGAAPS